MGIYEPEGMSVLQNFRVSIYQPKLSIFMLPAAAGSLYFTWEAGLSRSYVCGTKYYKSLFTYGVSVFYENEINSAKPIQGFQFSSIEMPLLKSIRPAAP